MVASGNSGSIGRYFDGTSYFYDGYMAEVNFIDGQALTPSSFGETDAVTGSWVAKKYTGTYGTNGFYLKFANDSDSLSSQYGALLNGSSQFVSLTPTTAFNFSNNNWTIETFLWPNGTTNQVIFNYGYEGSTNRCMVFYYSGGNLNLAYSTNGSNNTDTSCGAHNMPMNQWHHLAIVAITNTQLLTLQDATLIDNSTNNFTLTNNGSFSISAGIVPYATPSIAADYSGNFNNFVIGSNGGWNANDISDQTYDVMYDSPTLTSATVANYCTLHPLPYYGGYNVLSRGNLQFTSGNTNWMRALATFAVSSGKWYWEVTVNNTLSQMHGITHATQLTYSAGATNWVGYDATGYAYFSDNGTKYNSNSGVTYGATYGAGDVIGIAFDADNGKLYFSKNGTFQASGDPAAGTNAAFTGLTNGPYVPAVSLSTFSGANTCDANFGQRPFKYTPPTGFKRLNTYNLPDSTILKGNKYMDATLYTGSTGSVTVTNAAGFKPDMVWMKARSGGVTNHALVDSVRPSGYAIYPNLTDAEANNSTLFTGITSNGFTLAGNNATYSGNGYTYVGWQWQAGQGSTSSGTGTGGITSVTQSVNTTAGFSIVTYTGSGSNGTVTHGLGVAPKMVIVKNRTTAGDEWCVWHTSLTNATYYLYLNGTAAQAVDTTFWNSTAPSSTVISLGSNGRTNRSSSNMVCYAWSEIAGFSKFGSYTGNGSADGPMIYCNFSPKFFLVKRTDTVESWNIVDTSRNTYNQAGANLYPNLSNAESTNNSCDILSNGIKLRNTWAGANANGGTYIFMAFASNPFKSSNAR